jgi:hypothetical protein
VTKIKVPHEKFPKLQAKKEKLDTYFDKLTKAGFNAVGNINMGMIDFLIIGVVKRSLDLVDGFILTISNWNLICAAPIIRMHLDTLLRLNYVFNIPPKEADKLIHHIMDGEPLHKFKDLEGKRLTDGCLLKYTKDVFPWIDNVYEQTSKFIHFSERHMFVPIFSTNNEKRIVNFAIHKGSHNVEEKQITEYYDVFIIITDSIIKFINSWGERKRNLSNSELL